MESKSEKFIRLANARTNKCVAAIQSLSKLSNTNHYAYTDAQVEQIIRELRDAVRGLEAELQEPQKKESVYAL